ncbi:thiazole synthase [Candidatus Woesearchaeota archaeon]|nr:thiazole synthase [Candidatus Woesearchaeota archaeon]
MLKIGKYTLDSRLILGTGKYPNYQMMHDALVASGTKMVTVALRRIDLHAQGNQNIFNFIPKEMKLLPNTAGCYNAEDALLTSHLAREALQTDLIKLEVIGNEKTLFPDTEQLLAAAKILVDEGFTVLPYTNDDPIVCEKLIKVGCSAVMPLAAPIGSGLGITNPINLKIIVEQFSGSVPIIIDAGVGTASDAAIALELGCDGLLMNTAIASASDPVKMATAMKYAVEAGRLAFEAGRIAKKLYATASSPVDGVVHIK